MTNKLLLIFAMLASINLVNATSTTNTISYPVNVATGGQLNLQTSDAYVFTATCSATSDDADSPATIVADKDVTYGGNFSATGNVSLSFSNVTFNGDLTLAKTTISSQDYNPTMNVSSSMAFGNNSTVNTGGTTVQFGSGGSINITNGTFTKLNASGLNANDKLSIEYSDANTIRTDYEVARTQLSGQIANCTLTNASIQDLWVTKGKGEISGAKLKVEKIVDSNYYNVSIIDMTSPASPGTKFIADDETLNKTLDEKSITVIPTSETNDMGTDEAVSYSVDFGADINKNTTAEDKAEITPNTAGNVLIDWEATDTGYDLLSSPESTNTSYTFNMNIKPSVKKTLSLKTTNAGLKTITFNGEQNNNLTVALKSASMTDVEFSPEVASFCKINATATQKDLNLKVSNHTKGQGETTAKEFVISDKPTVDDEKGYSLEIGKNVNVKLTNTEYTFKGITVVAPASGDLASEITVGSGAILNL